MGCAQQPAQPATPETTPTPETTEIPETTPEISAASDIIIKEREVTPSTLEISAGTEVSISVEGNTPHIIQIIKAAEGSLGPRVLENFGTITNGGKITYTFTDPGMYTIKSSKVGSVIVAVTVK